MNDMFPATIDKEELNKLPLTAFGGEIHLIDSGEGLRKFLPPLMKEKVIGFDTETRPAFKKGQRNRISLLQFSTRFHAYLIRVGTLGITDGMVELLQNERILKVGAAVRDDLDELRAVREFRPGGFLDLQKYVEAFGITNKAVAKMAGIVLGFRISKTQQLSNWDAETLSRAQLLYAATDAWVCFRIHEELQNYLPE